MRILLFGTFDHLHPGHRFVLNAAMERSDDVWVVVGLDANVAKIKGHAPDQSEDVRKRAIEVAYPSAHVLFGHPSDFLARLREIQPDLILFGYDQQLPPGISEENIGVPIERLEPFHPEKYKSSLRRNEKNIY